MSIVLTVLNTILLAASPTETTAQLGPVKVEEALPTIAGWTLNETLWSSRKAFESNKANVTVLSYFSTTCKPCIPGLKTLSKINTEKIDVVLVALDQNKASVDLFLKRHQVQADTVILDKYTKIAQRHGVADDKQKAQIPKTFLVDKRGKVKKIYISEGNDFKEHLLKSITSLSND